MFLICQKKSQNTVLNYLMCFCEKVAVEVLSDGIDEMFHLSNGIIDEMLRGLCFTMSLVFEDNIIIPPAAHEME